MIKESEISRHGLKKPEKDKSKREFSLLCHQSTYEGKIKRETMRQIIVFLRAIN
jgi:hypothetical protein